MSFEPSSRPDQLPWQAKLKQKKPDEKPTKPEGWLKTRSWLWNCHEVQAGFEQDETHHRQRREV